VCSAVAEARESEVHGGCRKGDRLGRAGAADNATAVDAIVAVCIFLNSRGEVPWNRLKATEKANWSV